MFVLIFLFVIPVLFFFLVIAVFVSSFCYSRVLFFFSVIPRLDRGIERSPERAALARG